MGEHHREAGPRGGAEGPTAARAAALAPAIAPCRLASCSTGRQASASPAIRIGAPAQTRLRGRNPARRRRRGAGRQRRGPSSSRFGDRPVAASTRAARVTRARPSPVGPVEAHAVAFRRGAGLRRRDADPAPPRRSRRPDRRGRLGQPGDGVAGIDHRDGDTQPRHRLGDLDPDRAGAENDERPGRSGNLEQGVGGQDAVAEPL